MKTYQNNLRRSKQRIERRIAPRNWTDQPRPMFKGNIHYEISDRIRATGAGGVYLTRACLLLLCQLLAVCRRAHGLRGIFGFPYVPRD